MTLTLGIVLAALFALTGIAKLVAVPAMRSAAAHLGFTTAQYRGLGAVEVAAATGIAIGSTVHWIGMAAAVGLVLLMLGAMREHVRHGDGTAHIAVPVIVGVLAVAYVVLLAASSG